MPRWAAREVELSIPVSDGLIAPWLLPALRRSAQRWNEAASSSGAPRLVVRTRTQAATDAIQDGVSVVLLRRDKWCPTRARDEEEGCYDQARQAITHLFFNQARTAVVEADLEVNGVRAAWMSSGGHVQQDALDALLVHELGHVLGLDHSCGLRMSRGSAAADGMASCDTTSARASVMYPDPLEQGRPLQLEPTDDAVQLLREAYGGKQPNFAWTGVVLAITSLCLLLGFAVVRRRLATARAKAT